ncbi:MAG: aminotransferase class V-fold PLP-dependent enzyme [Candidatus Cloacimonetes bacterium]|nr:aminotransferase class V-fold PLP-dependent enzyme [Candidatus Cloacimonadota bacterium]
MTNPKELIRSLDWLRADIIGRNIPIPTPYGLRPLVYADYTASGRGLRAVERATQRILAYYANTHTEDDFTGKTMTALLHDAEKIIKDCVNAGPGGKIVFTGSGSTGGVNKLMQILGVYWPPATRERIGEVLKSCLLRNPGGIDCNQALHDYMDQSKPIVFVGPYEHHSNEIMWRQTLCEIVEIPLNQDSELNLSALEKMVSDPRYAGRLKIGSFSAASNVTGLRTPVYEVARILHRHSALACFDFAACAPYVEIDMNRDAESCFDAIFFSPHKFLGGPGTSGILIFNERIYPKNLPPTVSAGGTVSFVSNCKEEYFADIESREKPGTPGIMQALRVALAFQLKNKVGQDNIDRLEKHLYERFIQAFRGDERIIFYGPLETGKKVPIVPFNIRHRDRVLHPKFVTRLINDLFGIQTRAGCSCAGPYGHHLMQIQTRDSDYYRCLISNAGYSGIKPGWVRLNLHYSMTEAEVDYFIAAVRFVLEHGYKFLSQYEFNIKNGEWTHLDHQMPKPVELDLELGYGDGSDEPAAIPDAEGKFPQYLEEAERVAERLPEDFALLSFKPELERLLFFYVHKMTGI